MTDMFDIPTQPRLLAEAAMGKTCEEFWKNRLTRMDYLDDKVKIMADQIFDLEALSLKVRVMSDQIIELHRMILEMKKENEK